MNRSTKLNYLLLGVLGGMLAMWACGEDGGGAADANAQSCGRYRVKQYEQTEPSLAAGEEPFAVFYNQGYVVFVRSCAD